MGIADDTERAYRVYVSEVMLQQTQVPRVKVAFRQFLERFPSLEALAAASNKDVVLAWRGMGYNSRALRMRDAARIVRDAHGGIFPREMDALLSIKGIGGYTAAAVRNFAFALPTPCIDTNIRRILHRTFVGPESADGTWEKSDRELLGLAGQVLGEAVRQYAPRPAAADWHAALMDFGSLVQTKRNPKWAICPLTAAGVMKANPRNFPVVQDKQRGTLASTEPGRMIAGRFVPNRIIRGRIVEALRDAEDGLPFEEIGATVCVDWSTTDEMKAWLAGLLRSLERDGLIADRRETFVLAD